MLTIDRNTNDKTTFQIRYNEYMRQEVSTFQLHPLYKKICDADDMGVGEIFKPVNDFFHLLSRNEQLRIKDFYDLAASVIAKRPLEDAVKAIRYNFEAACQKLDLFNRLVLFVRASYVNEMVTPPITEGTIPKVELTYVDGVDIAAMCIICKMMFPIWSELLSRATNSLSGLDAYNEITAPLVNSLNQSRFANTYQRVCSLVQVYADDIQTAHPGLKERLTDDDRAIAISGSLANLVAKRWVYIELTRHSVPVWTATSVKQILSSLLGTLAKRAPRP
jgi:hypothetical protein